MSNFLVCLMLLVIARATNQEFVSSHADAIMIACALAFILDLIRVACYFSRNS